MLEVIVLVPHLVAVCVVVAWLLYGRRFNEGDPRPGQDGHGGKRTQPPTPELPLIGRNGRIDELARSA